MIETFETVAKAVADPNRTRILKLLEGGELCVCQITTVINLSPGGISKHLNALKAAGLVQQRRGGKWVYYRLADREINPNATQFLALLRDSLNDDPTVVEDRELLSHVNFIPLGILCAQGRAAIAPVVDEPLSSPCCGVSP